MLLTDQSRVTKNVALNGGGYYQDYVKTSSITMRGSAQISRNTAEFGGGGAYLERGAVALVGSTSVSSIMTLTHGGGTYSTLADITLRGSSSVTGNQAAGEPETYNNSGGGIYVEKASVVLIGSSTISGNTANDDGGGISSWSGATILNDHSSVDANIATRGGESSAAKVYSRSVARRNMHRPGAESSTTRGPSTCATQQP